MNGRSALLSNFSGCKNRGVRQFTPTCRELSKISLCLFLPWSDGCAASRKAIHTTKTETEPEDSSLLGDVFLKSFFKYSFASAKNISSLLDISASTVKDLRARELGLRTFTQRWVPHSRSERQKNERVTQSRLLLDLLQRHQKADFNAIATGDGSETCIQLALCMPDPGVALLLASVVESAHHKL
jgi:hypothetical protein